MRKLAVLALFSLCAVGAYAFNISGSKWPGAVTHLYIGIPGSAPSGKSWSEALRRAAQAWTDNTPFTFATIPSYRDPCMGYGANSGKEGFPAGKGDGHNGADFTKDVCGNAFGTNVLAVAMVYTEANRLGTFDIVEADVVFNIDERFDIYDGVRTDSSGVTDFGRVALHELGHVLGMSHEATKSAIMRANIGNLFSLQEDDIAGATLLYGGYSNCPVRTLDFGRVDGQLADDDCTVQELMGGGNDSSLVDVYEFSLAQETEVRFSMSSSAFDPVLVLMTDKSAVIETSSDASEDTARIERTLAAGSYALLANTYACTAEDELACAESTGAYQITMSYGSSALLGLGRPASLLGGTSAAQFAGAVTTDKGRSYTNRVRSSAPFDVHGRITVDPAHRGQAGFIVVAGLLDDGEILLRDAQGQFISYDERAASIPKASTKLLAAQEDVDVLSNTVAAQLGIEDIQVNFLIGYGLDSEPGEVYFHSAPINLLVSP